MDTQQRIDAYLREATAGLAGDPELRLDIEAELRTHVEERVAELGESGRPDEEVVDEALKGLGAVTELAPELAEGNAARRSVRARLRLALQALLIPAALVAAVLCADPALIGGMRMLQSLEGDSVGGELDLALGAELTPSAALIVHGDRSRKHRYQQQRAIWEAYPENLAYLRHYVSYLCADYALLGETPEARLAAFSRELQIARRADPDNALYDYLLAGKQLALAAEIESVPQKRTVEGRQHDTDRLKVSDPALFGEAMATLRQAAAKPYFKRGQADVLADRLRLLGPANRLYQRIARIALAAGVLLPELSEMRQLSRAAVAHGEELAKAGKVEDAEPYLTASFVMGRQLASDSWTLIDILVANAVIHSGAEGAEKGYVAAGLPDRAAQAVALGKHLAAPVDAWQERRKAARDTDKKWGQEFRRRGGILAAMLLPALGEFPSVDEYTPSRILEYVVAEESFSASIMAVLVLTALVGGVIALRWRLTGGTAIPMLLVPPWRRAMRILILGVVVPLVLFGLYTGLPGAPARAYSILYTLPRLFVEAALLSMTLLLLPALLTGRFVRERCRDLGVRTPPKQWPWETWALGGLGGAAVLVLCLPVSTFAAGGAAAVAAYLVAGFMAAVLIVKAIAAVAHGLGGERQYALFYGSMARTMVLSCCAGAIIIALVSRPYLLHREATMLRRDTLMSVDPKHPGFTSIETQVTMRLRDGILQAYATAPPQP